MQACHQHNSFASASEDRMWNARGPKAATSNVCGVLTPPHRSDELRDAAAARAAVRDASRREGGNVARREERDRGRDRVSGALSGAAAPRRVNKRRVPGSGRPESPTAPSVTAPAHPARRVRSQGRRAQRHGHAAARPRRPAAGRPRPPLVTTHAAGQRATPHLPSRRCRHHLGAVTRCDPPTAAAGKAPEGK